MSAKKTVKYHPTPPLDGNPLPFSEAVQLGDTLYVSGQIGNTPGALCLVPGGIAAEARQAMENMKAILCRHGSSLNHVVKCTVYLASMSDWPLFNEIYEVYFGEKLPARSAVGGTKLGLGAKVEIDCIAAIRTE